MSTQLTDANESWVLVSKGKLLSVCQGCIPNQWTAELHCLTGSFLMHHVFQQLHCFFSCYYSYLKPGFPKQTLEYSSTNFVSMPHKMPYSCDSGKIADQIGSSGFAQKQWWICFMWTAVCLKASLSTIWKWFSSLIHHWKSLLPSKTLKGITFTVLIDSHCFDRQTDFSSQWLHAVGLQQTLPLAQFYWKQYTSW